ncbi:MAG: thiamine ABC transporter substrate binding subunit [Alphaproteobacteria bacterium]
MRRFFVALAAASLAASSASAHAETPTLTIYTYDSFTSEWGPGPAITQAFQADCGCTIEWVAVEDAGVLLSRLRLEGERTAADLVLGLDTNLMAEAEATGLFAPHGVDLGALALPIPWASAAFVPFDYGYFAFVYDSERLATPPASLAELVDGDVPVVIQDPRTSSPGLGLLLWMRQVYGDRADAAWARLAGHVVTVTKGWSEAYGLFLDGEAPMVLSYTTSPAYHEIVERTGRYRAAPFAEGHYLQVEVAGMVRTTDEPELARSFLRFMLTPAFQDLVPTGNWMFPATDIGDRLPEAFRSLPAPARALIYEPEEVAANRKAWIDAWLDAMTR